MNGFVIDMIWKMESVRIGFFFFDVLPAYGIEASDNAMPRHQRHRAGQFAAIDELLHARGNLGETGGIESCFAGVGRCAEREECEEK